MVSALREKQLLYWTWVYATSGSRCWIPKCSVGQPCPVTNWTPHCALSRCYIVELDSKKYQVEVEILENTDKYIHVMVADDDG